jgi:MHS family citrate/tricarballylate:H+ symporter-like MFS transporter
MVTSTDRKSKIWSVVRVSSGNFLEMYDFMVFGYFASAIGKAFFPSNSAFGSLMLSLMTFGAGFLMRPLGALVLGAYTDRHGRRAGLLLTLSMMSVGIFTIACTPGYATIGLLAPLLVVLGRLLQGFSAGMELGGVSVYLSEIATPGHKVFVGWRPAASRSPSCSRASVGVECVSILPRKDRRWDLACPLLPVASSFRSSSACENPPGNRRIRRAFFTRRFECRSLANVGR